MKKIKNLLKFFVGIPYMKYILVLVLGVVLIGFVGSSSVLAHLENKQRISELNEEIEYYESENSHSQARIHQLQTDPKAMEEIARERYFMRHADEDIFVLSDDDRTPFSKPSEDETTE